MLKVSEICVDRGEEHVLRGLSLMIRKGEVLVLTGSNGSGKTTALMAIAGRLPISSGSVEWTENIGGPPTKSHPRFGLFLQGGRVFQSMTVRENLEVACIALRRSIFANRIESLADELPLVGVLLNRRACFLSGGEKQVVALAMTVVSEPEVLLLDEPFAGVDESNANRILGLLAGIKRRNGSAILIVDHRRSCATTISDNTIVLEEGRSKGYAVHNDEEREHEGVS